MHVLRIQSFQVTIQKFGRDGVIKFLAKVLMGLEHGCSDEGDTTIGRPRRNWMKNRCVSRFVPAFQNLFNARGPQNLFNVWGGNTGGWRSNAWGDRNQESASQ